MCQQLQFRPPELESLIDEAIPHNDTIEDILWLRHYARSLEDGMLAANPRLFYTVFDHLKLIPIRECTDLGMTTIPESPADTSSLSTSPPPCLEPVSDDYTNIQFLDEDPTTPRPIYDPTL